MKIEKLKATDFVPGQFYSLLGLGESDSILMGKFIKKWPSSIVSCSLEFVVNQEHKKVIIGNDIAKAGINVVVHGASDHLFFIEVGFDFVIHGFESRDEAQTYIDSNQVHITKLTEQTISDEVKILTGSEVEEISSNVLWAQKDNGGSTYEPKWIEKSESLEEYIAHVG